MNRSETAAHAAELRKQAAELIRRAEVEEHYAKGGDVQFDCKYRGTRWDENDDPSWSWDRFDYRPKPKLVEVWTWGQGGQTFSTREEAEKDAQGSRVYMFREVGQP